ncbi:MAG: hypothetical protein HY999_05915 [Nitrospinae bacterium]|nr:hypothetical protein [Nitrospinota bacterium]
MIGRYNVRRLDFKKIVLYPIKERRNKVSIKDFTDLNVWKKVGRIEDLFPAILKGNDIRGIVEAVLKARERERPVVFAIGAHVIKCGLSPLVIDLMEKGVVSAIAMNGAGAIHDYEIALIGETSEDVTLGINEGIFGMAEETGAMMNSALKGFLNDEIGLGEAWGRDISEKAFDFRDNSILSKGFKLSIPVTIHVAFGTDITHIHPSSDGALIGKGTQNDFKLFTSVIVDLNDGGCFFNIGSSVILPEVFLKALSAVRNLGYKVKDFTTVNMDMIQHYRPVINVIDRPTQEGGRGYSLIGHHEIMIPLLYDMIVRRL